MLRDYVLGICAAAMITAIVLAFAEKGPAAPLLKLLCGLILTFSLVQPVLNLQAGDFHSLGIDFQIQGERLAEEGKEEAQKSVCQLIKEETEAYILDKARELKLDIKVSVELSDQPLPVPEAVTIYGSVSPFAKSSLSRLLTQELGIQKENQQWIS